MNEERNDLQKMITQALEEIKVQIAIPNGQLCHIRRPHSDLKGGQPGTN